MKIFILSILFSAGILFGLSLYAFAENFTYKVYNPRTNKAHTAVLGTVTVTDNEYIFGFFTKEGEPLCVTNLNLNKDSKGLIGSKCIETKAFMRQFENNKNLDLSKYEMGWRELEPDTFYKEINSIKPERATQGKYEIGENDYLGNYMSGIPSIPDADNIGYSYPVRKDAIIMLLQKVPDGSGDYTMTLCNKYYHCRQTSMRNDEVRYIGLFLEDVNPQISDELSRKFTKEQWVKRQNVFRELYSVYMNKYDETFGNLKILNLNKK